MAADYHCADSVNGDHFDDPSEDVIFMLVDDRNDTDNTCVVIEPDEDDPVWYVSVAVLDEGGYEIGRRDARRREHDVITETCIATIAYDLVLWLTARRFRGRPT